MESKNQYQFTLGSGKRQAYGQSVEDAFKSLGYSNFKVYKDGFKSWKIEVEGNKGHESTYYAKQY